MQTRVMIKKPLDSIWKVDTSLHVLVKEFSKQKLRQQQNHLSLIFDIFPTIRKKLLRFLRKMERIPTIWKVHNIYFQYVYFLFSIASSNIIMKPTKTQMVFS